MSSRMSWPSCPCVESGISGSHGIREYQESRSGMGVSGVPDIRESGPTGYPGYLRDIRDIRNKDQGWGYQVLSLPVISLIQHRRAPIVLAPSRVLPNARLACQWPQARTSAVSRCCQRPRAMPNHGGSLRLRLSLSGGLGGSTGGSPTGRVDSARDLSGSDSHRPDSGSGF
jgi:hypothetical protein